MPDRFVNPITAVFAGAILGLAIVAPFGGLTVFRAAQTGRVMTCDIMACRVHPARP